MAGLGRSASERSVYSVDVKAAEAYREPQKQAAGMLGMRWHRPSQGRVLTEDCQECGRQT
jgi:hypothetical protein